MIADNEVRYQSGSAAWQTLTEGTEAVMGQQLPDICMELYLNIQQALICYSCKEAVLRSPSDLIPVSCSVYPADTSVQKLHQIQPCTFGCKYVYVCTRICIGHMKEKKNVRAFYLCNKTTDTGQKPNALFILHCA